jgi:hypothetical protein
MIEFRVTGGVAIILATTPCATTSRKVAGSNPDEDNGFFSIEVILPAALLIWLWAGLGF